ncbi:MAG: peptide-methionine (S)-S-oxide reductase MsrA [Luteibaculum sp.]
MKKYLLLLSLPLFVGLACSQAESGTYSKKELDLQGTDTAYFASGCFWCVEAIFESVKGVEEVVSGYSGGKEKNPSYREVASGSTSHAEAVQVFYNPEIVSFETLLKVYYGSHNPTTVNGQHPDYGTQYRSIIFYSNPKEKELAEAYKKEVAKDYIDPIATEIVAFEKFWPAEDYHQDYEKKNPNQPYVRSVSIPRLNRFKEKFPELLK